MKQTTNTGEVHIPDWYMLGTLEDTFERNVGSGFFLLKRDLITVNNCKAAMIRFSDSGGSILMFSEVYIFVSDKYTYTILVFSTSREYLDSAEKNGIINSFRVKDTVSATNGIPFMDVGQNDWYYNSVKYVSENKIIKGTTNYTYNPNGKLTRGQLATILWRMAGMPYAKNGKNFPDVKSSDYYYEAVKWASANKVVNGYSNGTFGANNDITREQLAVMLQNYARYKKKSVTKKADISKYKDVSGVSSYAKDAVAWAIKNRIISGKENGTRIAPQGKATRAEVAAMIESYCGNV